MLNKIFTRQPRLEHADPAQRLLGLADLPADSNDIARLMTADTAPEIRAAAAQRCVDTEALVAAMGTETDPSVRAALSDALVSTLAEMNDDNKARALLAGESIGDGVRA